MESEDSHSDNEYTLIVDVEDVIPIREAETADEFSKSVLPKNSSAGVMNGLVQEKSFVTSTLNNDLNDTAGLMSKSITPSDVDHNKEDETEMKNSSCGANGSVVLPAKIGEDVSSNVKNNMNDISQIEDSANNLNGLNSETLHETDKCSDQENEKLPVMSNNVGAEVLRNLSNTLAENSVEVPKSNKITINGIGDQEKKSLSLTNGALTDSHSFPDVMPSSDVLSENMDTTVTNKEASNTSNKTSADPWTSNIGVSENGVSSENRDYNEMSTSENKKRKIDYVVPLSPTKRMKPASDEISDGHQTPPGNNSTATVKKNSARKHTSNMSVGKRLKDFESIVADALGKENSPSNIDEPIAERQDTSENGDGSYKNIAVESFSDSSLRNIFKTMRRNFSRRQIEEILLQKVCEMVSESNEIGDLKKQIVELKQVEAQRKLVCLNLQKQVHQLKGVCQVFSDKLRDLKEDDKVVPPTIITRSVGLQVAVDSSAYAQTNGDIHRNRGSSIMSSNTSSPRGRSSPIPASSPTVFTKTTETRQLPGNLNSDHNKSAPSCSSTRESSVTSLGKISAPLNRGAGTTTSVSDDDCTIIDLTDKDDKSEDFTNNTVTKLQSSVPSQKIVRMIGLKHDRVHPAPLPPTEVYQIASGMLKLPPRPDLTITRNNEGISLSWTMQVNQIHAKIAKYQIYAYQETNAPFQGNPWKLVGDVIALPLPMECTLTQFFNGYTYHFSVRAVDDHQRLGPFSVPSSIAL